MWYGQCGKNPDIPQRDLNCADSGPARPAVAIETLELLDRACPHMAQQLREESGEVRLCCDDEQLRAMVDNFAMFPDKLLGRCPTCLYNFKKNFCDLTCRPDQSTFVNATKIVRGKNAQGLSNF